MRARKGAMILNIRLTAAVALFLGATLAQAQLSDDLPAPAAKKSTTGAKSNTADLSDLLEPPSRPAPKRTASLDPGPEAGEATPAALLKSMQDSLNVTADDGNPAEVRSAFRKAFDAILANGDKVIKHPRSTVDQKNEAYQFQASILYQGARKGELGYPERLERLAETLHRDQPKSDVANLASFLSVKARYEDDDGLRTDALPAIQQYLRNYPREEAAIELLLDVAHQAEAEGRNSIAKESLDVIAKTFKRHEVAAKIPAVLKRLDLVGKKLNLDLSLADGRRFVVDDRKRMVVISFWATWSPPSVAEQEILKDLYSRFKSDGLEIVGVPLDEKETTVQQFTSKNKIAWPQNVVPADSDAHGFNHPVAKQYGIMQLPTNFLVENGKVVSTQTRGQALRRKVDELMSKGSPVKMTEKFGDLPPVK